MEVFGEWIGGAVAREPLYDAEGARVRSSDVAPIDTRPAQDVTAPTNPTEEEPGLDTTPRPDSRLRLPRPTTPTRTSGPCTASATRRSSSAMGGFQNFAISFTIISILAAA